MQEINQNILTFFNNLMDYNFIRTIVPLLADLPIFLLPIFLLWFWFYYAKNKDNNWKNNLLFIFWWVVLWISINLIIQQFTWDIQRPEDFIKNAKNLILNHIPDASFPSDHATVSISFLTWLFLFWYKKYFYYFLVFIILMLLSRIIAAVHWPFDILWWTLVWIFSAFIIFKLRKNKFLLSINDFIIKIMEYIKL
jgi:undecaprenyl-diphosphatase